MENKCLCIVDDDDVFQYLALKAVEQVSFELRVITFLDGEKAYKFIQENSNNIEKLPDIILLDINMPYMDGWSFVKEYIKLKPKLSKKIDIYMVSSSVDESDIKKANSISEISDYIIKPVTPDKIEELILLAPDY